MGTNTATPRRRRILVVDDDLDILESTALVLRSGGYDVETVDRGAAVVSAIRRERPDLVLLDMRMPDMSGLEVCGALSREQDLAEIPVVAFSADRGMAERLGNLRIVAFLEKPFDFDDLIGTIERYASQAPTKRA